jgi:hypothetical protein
MTGEQASLFDPPPRPVGHARPQFLAGILGVWLYGDKTVPKAVRESLVGLAERTLTEAERIKELRS